MVSSSAPTCVIGGPAMTQLGTLDGTSRGPITQIGAQLELRHRSPSGAPNCVIEGPSMTQFGARDGLEGTESCHRVPRMVSSGGPNCFIEDCCNTALRTTGGHQTSTAEHKRSIPKHLLKRSCILAVWPWRPCCLKKNVVMLLLCSTVGVWSSAPYCSSPR
jgi:hypothetical protein